MSKKYGCMPLKSNIEQPYNSHWRLTKCPNCGKECWETPLQRNIKQQNSNLQFVCTECAIKLAVEMGDNKNGSYRY
jgi:transcription elongation factor Elf1